MLIKPDLLNAHLPINRKLDRWLAESSNETAPAGVGHVREYETLGSQNKAAFSNALSAMVSMDLGKTPPTSFSEMTSPSFVQLEGVGRGVSA